MSRLLADRPRYADFRGRRIRLELRCENVENVELHLEFDGVDDGLEHDLVGVQVDVLGEEHGDVEHQNEHVRVERVPHDRGDLLVVPHLAGVVEVHCPKHHFLNREHRHLDLLNDAVPNHPERGPDNVGAEREHCRREVREHDVVDDEVANATDDVPFDSDDAQTRIHDDGEARDHAVPADSEDNKRPVNRAIADIPPEEQVEEPDGEQEVAERCAHQGPEVQRLVRLERAEDQPERLTAVVNGNCSGHNLESLENGVHPLSSPNSSIGPFRAKVPFSHPHQVLITIAMYPRHYRDQLQCTRVLLLRNRTCKQHGPSRGSQRTTWLCRQSPRHRLQTQQEMLVEETFMHAFSVDTDREWAWRRW